MIGVNKEQLAITIGKRLKALRKASTELGQKEIADEFGITKQAVSGYESGRFIPDITILIAFAERYSCSVDYLLGLDDKVCRASETVSEDSDISALLDSLDKVSDEERGYLAAAYTEITKPLAISKGNPQRRKFVECIGELAPIMGSYMEECGATGERLSEQSASGTLTPEDVAVEVTRLNGFDSLSRTIDDFRRIGIGAVISFSVGAKKVLRIRTGWKPKGKKGDD